MKKNLLTIAAAIFLGLQSCVNYDAEINNLNQKVEQSEQSLADLERRISALENQVTVTSKEQIANGYRITFSDGSIIDIVNGADGADGANGIDGVKGVDGISVTLVERVGDKIIFYLSDGTQFSIDAPADGVDGTDGTDGTDGNVGSDGVSVESITMDGNIITFTMSDGTIYRLALNQTTINSIIVDQLDSPGSGSYLVSDDPDAVASFKWTKSSTGAVNISAPIYIHAIESGNSMSNTAKIAIRDLENKLALPLDDLENVAATKLRSWDLLAVLYAYEKTGEQKYLDLADRVWPIHKTLHETPRGGSIDYFGFDMYGALKTATLMVKHSSTHKTEAESLLASLTQHLIDNDDDAVTTGVSAWSNWAYYALIQKEFGVGDYTVQECYDNFYANSSTIFASSDYVQEVAYGTLAFSDIDGFDVNKHLNYFNNAIVNDINISEVLVEVIHANYFLMHK